MTERDLQYRLAKRLGEYFNVDTEVKTNCGDGRVDLILRCKKTDIVMAVEIKKANRKRGRDIGMLIKQASKYAQATFLNNLKIPVFVYPAISYDYLICPEEKKVINGEEYFRDRHSRESIHHTFQGILGVFNVGELRVFTRNSKKYIRFVFNNKLIWTNQPEWNSKEIMGLHSENYKNLISRINDNDI